MERLERTCSILRQASIPHFAKYIGTPEIITSIDQHMRALRDKGTGVAVTILETGAGPWNGRHFPREYTIKEMLALMRMVTLGTHGLQFFGGIQSLGHPCLAGSTYVAYNMKNKNELVPCCHRSDTIAWGDTVFNKAPAGARPCRSPRCHGDLMFILGLQGFDNEVARFEQVCLGNSPAVGLEEALVHVKSVADRIRLVDHERFEHLYAAVMGDGKAHDKPAPVSVPAKPEASASDKGIPRPATPAGKAKLKSFYGLLRRMLQEKACRRDDEATRQAYHPYYYDDLRWQGQDAWKNMAKHQAGSLLGFPLKFNIEVTTQCVFKCEFCVLHGGRLAKRRSRLFMKYDDFVNIFLQIQSFATHIEFTGGEPLLNKDIYKMIALCSEAKIKTTIATNAKLLSAQKITSLLDAPPSSLLIAYEAGQVEAYEQHRVGGSLDLLEHNIKGFIQERTRRGLAYPRVQLQTVVSRKTVPYMDSFWRDAEQLAVDEACSKPIFVWPDGDAAHWELMRSKYLIPDHPLSYYPESVNSISLTCIQGAVWC